MAGAVKIGDPKIYRESHAEADNNRYLTGFSELLIFNRGNSFRSWETARHGGVPPQDKGGPKEPKAQGQQKAQRGEESE